MGTTGPSVLLVLNSVSHQVIYPSKTEVCHSRIHPEKHPSMTLMSITDPNLHPSLPLMFLTITDPNLLEKVALAQLLSSVIQKVIGGELQLFT